MALPKAGLITFGDNREHEWNNYFKALAEPRHREAIEYFRSLALELVAAESVARHKQEIDAQVAALKPAGVEALIAHIPCWCPPNLVLRGVMGLDLPTVLVTSRHPSTHGSVGLMGAGGALSQIGKDHLRVREDFGSPRFESRVLPFLRAASALGRLRGQEMGLFGGRSLGIDTATFDPMQWRALFGVDVEHFDQLEIIRRAEAMDPGRIAVMVKWLTGSVGSVSFNDAGATPEKLAFQCACYLATKDIIAEKRLDFVAIKCMPDLATDHVPQCISAGLLPALADHEGPKESVVMGCEADADGALTMQILKEVSGGRPTYFGDVSHILNEAGIMCLPNCGAFCTWFAGRSDDPAANMRRIELRPSIRRGGGCIPYFTAAPGPITLARLYRKSGQYRMAIIPAEVIEMESGDLADFIKSRGTHQLPTAFVRVKLDFDRFIEEFGSNHISGVAGGYAQELIDVCRLAGITPVVMDERF
jgi:L-fucose isomerase